ncbi:MAG: AtpZ/AtpI family protein [Deltaproteobacteria bacterium]|nr:AtpZ/AtpI family protein [Deltaproteobacteria bacterium]
MSRFSIKDMKASILGLEMGISIALGIFGGNYIDGRYGTKPWGIFLGLALGLGAAFRSMWKTVKSVSDDK